MTAKYGKGISEAAVNNKLDSPHQVNQHLIEKLCISTPKQILIERCFYYIPSCFFRYLIAIAEKYGVPFKPNMEIVKDDEICQAEVMLAEFCGNARRVSAPIDSAVGILLVGNLIFVDHQ